MDHAHFSSGEREVHHTLTVSLDGEEAPVAGHLRSRGRDIHTERIHTGRSAPRWQNCSTAPGREKLLLVHRVRSGFNGGDRVVFYYKAL